MAKNTEPGSFVSDVAELRRRARAHLEQGAITPNYQGNPDDTVRILNDAVATEIVCILRYKFHAIAATGLSSDSVKAEFTEHATDEERHLGMLAERINQLGGRPNMNPDGLSERSATEYVEGANLVEMIKENLVAERIAVETYRDMIRHFANNDPRPESCSKRSSATRKATPTTCTTCSSRTRGSPRCQGRSRQ
jgi:bacterioferritin